MSELHDRRDGSSEHVDATLARLELDALSRARAEQRQRVAWQSLIDDAENTFEDLLNALASSSDEISIHFGAGSRVTGSIVEFGKDFVALLVEGRGRVIIGVPSVHGVEYDPPIPYQPAAPPSHRTLTEYLEETVPYRSELHVTTSGNERQPFHYVGSSIDYVLLRPSLRSSHLAVRTQSIVEIAFP